MSNEIIISDDDFLAFNELEFEYQDTNNNINLPHDYIIDHDPIFGSKYQHHNTILKTQPVYHDTAIEFTTPISMNLKPLTQHRVKMNQNNNHSSTSNNNNNNNTVVKYNNHDINNNNDNIIHEEEDEDDEDKDQIPIDPNQIQSLFQIDQDNDLRPVEGESQLQDYFNYLASQLEDDNNEQQQNQIRHPSDEDGEWQEHHNANLNHIQSQHDEKNKIKIKKSTIQIALKKIENNDNTIPTTTIKSTTTSTTTTPRLLSLSPPILNENNNTTNDIAINSTTTTTSSSTTTTATTSSSKPTTIEPIKKSKPLLTLPSDVAELLNSKTSLSSSLPLNTTTFNLLTHNDEKKIPLLHQTTTNINNNNDDFDVNFLDDDDPFLSIATSQAISIEQHNKLLEAHKIQLQLQRQRLSKLANQKNQFDLLQEQEHFFNKITQAEIQLQQVRNNNPLLALGINKQQQQQQQSKFHPINSNSTSPTTTTKTTNNNDICIEQEPLTGTDFNRVDDDDNTNEVGNDV